MTDTLTLCVHLSFIKLTTRFPSASWRLPRRMHGETWGTQTGKKKSQKTRFMRNSCTFVWRVTWRAANLWWRWQLIMAQSAFTAAEFLRGVVSEHVHFDWRYWGWRLELFFWFFFPVSPSPADKKVKCCLSLCSAHRPLHYSLFQESFFYWYAGTELII